MDVERVNVCPTNIVLDGTLVAQSLYFTECPVVESGNTVARIYLHRLPASSYRKRIECEHKRRSLLETRNRSRRFAWSFELTWRRGTNSKEHEFLVKINRSFEIVRIQLKLECFEESMLRSQWISTGKRLTVSKQTPRASRDLGESRFSFEPCLSHFQTRNVWLVHLARPPTRHV